MLVLLMGLRGMRTIVQARTADSSKVMRKVKQAFEAGRRLYKRGGGVEDDSTGTMIDGRLVYPMNAFEGDLPKLRVFCFECPISTYLRYRGRYLLNVLLSPQRWPSVSMSPLRGPRHRMFSISHDLTLSSRMLFSI